MRLGLAVVGAILAGVLLTSVSGPSQGGKVVVAGEPRATPLAEFHERFAVPGPDGAQPLVVQVDDAGIETRDEGFANASFRHLEDPLVCPIGCRLAAGDDQLFGLGPKTGDPDWPFHWASSLATPGKAGGDFANATVWADTNGYLAFLQPDAPKLASNGLPNTAKPNAVLAADWQDLDPDATTAPAGLYAAINGSSPDRVLAVEWWQVPRHGTDCKQSFEVLLFEADNHAEVLYLTTECDNDATGGEENSEGKVGFTYFDAPPPDDVAVRYKDVIAPALQPLSVACGTSGSNGWCRSATNSFTATDSNDKHVNAVGLGLQSRTWTVGDLNGSYTSGAATSVTLDDGTYTITAKAKDWAQNEDTKTASLKVDATPPNATLTTTCDQPGNAGWCKSSSYTWEASATDATSGLASQTCKVDGVVDADCEGTVSGEGAHSVSITATDNAGNTASKAVDLAIDSIAPTASLTKSCASPGNTGWCRSSSYTYTGTSTDANLAPNQPACEVDGVSADCSDTVSGEGSHTVELTTEDKAGNTNSASFDLAIDSIVPTATITHDCDAPGNPGWCRSSSYTYEGESEDANLAEGQPKCKVDGTSADCTGTVSGEGDHKVELSTEDKAGNTNSATLDLDIDSVAPVVDAAASCTAPGDNGWCRGTETVTFTATDATSGIATKTCTIDGATKDCEVATDVTTDGNHEAKLDAEDAAGHEASDTEAFKIDATPPTLTITTTCETPGNTGWCRSSSYTYEATATDATSGIALGATECTLDGNPAACTGLVTGEGPHTLTIKSKDNAGNSASASKSLGIDSVSPTTDMATICADPGNAGWCLEPSYDYEGTASDAGSGLATQTCKVDGAAKPCSGTVTGQGEHTVSITAEDNAGNSASDSEELGIDSIAPTVDVGQSCSAGGNNGWCRGAVSLAFTRSDAESGIATATCDVDGTAVDCASTEVSGQGSHTANITAEDEAGNSATDSESFKIDSVAPEVTLTTDCANPGNAGWCKSASYTYTASATDATSGIDAQTCKVDGAAKPCSGTVTGQGDHTVSTTATDKAGNTASKTVDLAIDSTVPTASLSKTCATPGSNGWCRSSSYTYTGTSTDANLAPGQPKCEVDGASAACSGTVSGEGDHTVDLSTEDEAGNNASASFSMGIDSVPPTVGITGSCSQSGDNGWCRGTYTATTSASDATSGLDSTTCQLDGASVACGTITSSAQGTHTVTLTAKDKAGNQASTTHDFKIDSVAPSATMSTNCAQGTSEWCRSSYTYSGTATDATSGLPAGQPTCTLDGGSVGCSGTVSSQGMHTLVTNARDNAGNTATASKSLGVDSVAPTVGITGSCAVPGANGWCRGTHTATTSASDPSPGSGIDTTTCTLDGASVACGTITVTSQGAHTVALTAKDKAGNGASTTHSFKIDSIAPTVTIATNCAVPAGPGWCGSPSYTYSVSSSDGGSGLSGDPTCTVDGAAKPCTGTVTGEGAHNLVAQQRDVAANTGSDSEALGIDTAPPELTVELDGTVGDNGWYRSSVSVTLTCTDTGAGVDEITYRLDGGAAQVYDGAFTVSGDDIHTLDATCTDNAGRSASESATIKIDTTKPDGDPDVDPATIDDYLVQWQATDATSGLARVEVVEYLLDQGTPVCTYTFAGEPGVADACERNPAPGAYCYKVAARDMAGNVFNGNTFSSNGCTAHVRTSL